MRPRAIVLRAPGTNCDLETVRALELAGARAEPVHVRALLGDGARLREADILVIPGGFSYGDDVSAGRLLANELSGFEPLKRFAESGRPVLGICNGFQVLVKTGLLPGGSTRQSVSLTFNDSGRFVCRWVRLRVPEGPCLFTEGLADEIELPIAHGEGKFVAGSQALLRRLAASGRLPLLYLDNPNGSQGGAAALCSEKGNCMGLMPHPERFLTPYEHPTWTRRRPEERELGLNLFRNAVRHVN